MEAYTTEEQQVEAIKKFWQQNGISILVGIFAGLGGVYGYNYYQDSQIAAQELESVAYNEALEGLSANNTAALETFVADNQTSGYAELGALMLAKTFVEAEQLDKAAEQLTWLVSDTEKEEVKALANYRLARIYVAQAKLEQALALTNQSYPESFKAQISELQGDIYLAQGNAAKARESYQAAADNNGLQGNPVLKMKLDDLAINTNVVAQ